MSFDFDRIVTWKPLREEEVHMDEISETLTAIDAQFVHSFLFIIRIVAHSFKYLENTATNGHLTSFTPWSCSAVPRRQRLLYILVLMPFLEMMTGDHIKQR